MLRKATPALGKGEVRSSILRGGTSFSAEIRHFPSHGPGSEMQQSAERRKNVSVIWHVSDTRCSAGVLVATAILALLSATHTADAAACPWTITGVADGDTLIADVPCLPEPLRRVLVRVVGVDAPEAGSKARCDREADLAIRATAYTEAMVMRSGPVEMEFVGWDKWGGRADAVVLVGGVNLADALIGAHLGRAYDGGKRGEWCE